MCLEKRVSKRFNSGTIELTKNRKRGLNRCYHKGWRKREAFKVLDNLYKFMVKGTVKKVRGRNKEYDETTILKLLVLLTLAKKSYRRAKRFLEGNGEYIEYLGLKTIPSFQTLCRRAKRIPLHEIVQKITKLFTDLEGLERKEVTVDLFRERSCKGSTAQRRRKRGKYKDQGPVGRRRTKAGVTEERCIYLLIWSTS